MKFSEREKRTLLKLIEYDKGRAKERIKFIKDYCDESYEESLIIAENHIQYLNLLKKKFE